MHANLVLFKKDGTQRVIPLSSEITILGRRHDCDLRIPLKPISRRHCQFSKSNGDLMLRDLDSQGGTFLNGQKVSESKINAGDYLKVGPLTFQLQIDGKPEKVSPPQKKQAQAKPASAPQHNKPDLDLSGSAPALDLSDSFMAELENL